MNVQQALKLHKNDEVTVKANGFLGDRVLTVSYIEPVLASPRDAVPAHLEVVDAAKEVLKVLNHTTDRNFPEELPQVQRRLKLALESLPVTSVTVWMTDGSKYHNSCLA